MKEDIATRNILNIIRNTRMVNQKPFLTEEVNNDPKSIAITDDPKFGQSVLTNQIQQFKSTVDGSAQFAKPSDNVADCPLIYIPKSDNLVFSGTIPRLNNLKFQFVLRTDTGNGCFIWCDGLILNNENMRTLQKLQGFYLNWQEQWESQSSDLEKLKNIEN